MRKNDNNYFRCTYGCLCGFGTVAAKDGWDGRRQVETKCTVLVLVPVVRNCLAVQYFGGVCEWVILECGNRR